METKKHNPFTAEIQIQYDEYMAQRNFQENFQLSPLVEYKNRGCNYYQYIDWGNIKLIDYAKELFTIKTRSRHILYKFIEWIDEDDRKDLSVEEIHEEILNYYSFKDLDDFAENEIDDIKIDRHYLIYKVIGYSQGDCAYVIIPTKKLREVWKDNKTNDYDLVSKQYINSLFFDWPIWGKIKIFAEEGQDYTFKLSDILDIPEYLNYSQDIDFVNEKILEFIKKRFGSVPAFENIYNAVKDALPEEIETPRYCY